MVNIYGLQDHVSKLALWNRLTDFMHHHNGFYIMFGDMNAVRNAQERFGTTLNSIEADHFNSFIDSTGLVDLPIGGRSFTWMNKAGTKLSKLDRFQLTIPIKVNIFAWKVSLDRLPTRSNLARRGVLVPSSSCLICNVSDEELAHLLFRCDLAIEVTRLVYRWWNLVWIPFDSYISWLSWIKALRMNSRSKSVLEGVFYTACCRSKKKLDHFLISEDVTIRLPDVRITALDRLWSDHNPILLHIDKTDFGPTPFKLYNSWLLRDGFDNLIKEKWELLD
ncbi:RNA-directed DNA polymerase, eukaryota, partial [Tanacetum coccineum]